MTEIAIKNHPVVSQTEWLEARKDLLAKEKDFIGQRRELPWVKVNKEHF
jgi:predicted dithiol-disulfide oxidoreductase (DUF899 family)